MSTAGSTVDLSFLPDARRAREVDGVMAQKLFASLRLIEAEAAALGAPLGVVDPVGDDRVATPTAWAHYHNLCDAIVAEDAAGVRDATADLRAAMSATGQRRILNLTDDDLGLGCAAVVAQMIDDNPSFPLDLEPVDKVSVERIVGLLPAALRLVEQGSADLAVEFDVFARQIILASGRKAIFSGASTVFLWGAILLNPDQIPDRLTLVEALTHETAHSLLTGLTAGKDVTTNDPDQRYASPLREDLRPMEGIAHATFVLARMIFALERVERSAALPAEERDRLGQMISANTRLFEAGRRIVSDHAAFTPAGAAIFRSCFAEMDELLAQRIPA